MPWCWPSIGAVLARDRQADSSGKVVAVECRTVPASFLTNLFWASSFEFRWRTMILGRIVGTVVSTRKDPRLEGKKLLVVKPISPEGADESGYLIAVDTVDSGFRETVLVVTGSSARMAAEC